MKTPKFVAVVMALALLVGLHPNLKAKPRSQGPAVDHTKGKLAIDVVRVINTAQYKYKQSHGAYAAWPDLDKSAELSEALSAFPGNTALANIHLAEQAEILPGWNLRLKVTGDGKSYQLSLEDVTDKKCRYAVVSDERGLIRQALAIDCSL